MPDNEIDESANDVLIALYIFATSLKMHLNSSSKTTTCRKPSQFTYLLSKEEMRSEEDMRVLCTRGRSSMQQIVYSQLDCSKHHHTRTMSSCLECTAKLSELAM